MPDEIRCEFIPDRGFKIVHATDEWSPICPFRRSDLNQNRYLCTVFRNGTVPNAGFPECRDSVCVGQGTYILGRVVPPPPATKPPICARCHKNGNRCGGTHEKYFQRCPWNNKTVFQLEDALRRGDAHECPNCGRWTDSEGEQRGWEPVALYCWNCREIFVSPSWFRDNLESDHPMRMSMAEVDAFKLELQRKSEQRRREQQEDKA